ncbi:MAG: HYR domain-containing protein [Psychroserpens sp.]|uniref:HYR domain-containing protein n=1 Tax=Psychroserpens sp. TaxID=2020870 RepID=UPI003C815594
MKIPTTFLFIILSLSLSIGLFSNNTNHSKIVPVSATAFKSPKAQTTSNLEAVALETQILDVKSNTVEVILMAPTVTCQDITVQLDAIGNATITPEQIEDGTYGSDPAYALSADQTTFTCSDLGSNSVTLTLTEISDSSTSTCLATVTIEDSVSPTLTGTAYSGTSGTNSCSADAATAAPFNASLATNGYTDNCGGAVSATLTNTATSGTDNAWTVTYTFSISDTNGNTLTDQTYSNTGGDATAPTLTGTAYSGTSGTNSCSSDAATAAPFNASLATNGYTDNCGGAVSATLTNTTTSGTDNSWTVTYTFTISDDNGNDLIGQTYSNTGSDTTAPTLTGTAYAGTSGTSSCSSDAATAAPFNASLATNGYTDNCGGAVSATLTNTATTGTDNSWTVTYTFTISDDNGNDLIGQTYSNTGSDTTAPTLTGTAYAGISGSNSCSSDAATAAPFNASLATNGYTDNCGGSVSATLTNTATSGTDSAWTVTYTFSISDTNGNTLSDQTYSNTGGDTTAPTLTGTAYAGTSGTNSCSSDAATAAPFNASLATNGYTDNCGGAVSATLTNTATTGTDNAWTVTYTFSISDTNGNTLTGQTYSNTGGDTTNPTASNPADINVQCLDDVPAFDISVVNDETDNCGTTSVAFIGQTPDPAINNGTITRTYRVSDGNGNSIDVFQDINITDTQDPTASDLALVTVECASDIPTANINLVNDEADNCSGPITVAFVSDVSDGNFNPETITRTYSVTDASGNSINVTQLITVEDTINPNAICIGGTTTIQLDSSGNGSISTTDVDNGSNDNCGAVDLSFVGGTPDLSNNIALGKPASQSSNYNSGNSYPASFGVDGNTGNFTHTQSSNNIGSWWEVDLQADFEIGLIRIWNRSNCCQNRLNDYRITLYNGATVVASQDFTTQPSLSLDITSLTGAADRVRVTQLKNAPLSLGEFQVYASGGGALDFDCSDLGSQTVTMVATDGSGNTDSCSHQVNVVDNINPSITCPPNVNVDVDSDTTCEATGVVLGTPTTSDNCAVATVTNNAPTSYPVGNTTVIWTVTDQSGNTNTCNQIVTVTDNVDPVITCPSNITQDTDAGLCSAIVTYALPTATDCSTVTITQIDGTGLSSGSVFPIGTTTLEYQALDDTNLLDTCTFTITVIDNENPTVTAPMDVTASTDVGACGANISIANATVTDNCAGSALSWEMTGVTLLTGTDQVGTQSFNIGITTITYTVADASGNTSTDTMEVVVADDEDPVITAPADITISAGVNCQVNSLSLGAASSGDNCGVANVTNDAVPPYVVGDTVVTWTVTDNAGNTSTDTQTITVVDDIAPTLTLPSTIINANTSEEGDYNCSVDISIPAVTATDNCSGSMLTWEMTGATNNGGTGLGQVPSPYTFNLGVTTVEYTVTDTATPPMSISKTLTITVFDDEDPMITALSDVVVTNDAGVCGASVSWTEPSASDNCLVSSFTQTTGFSNPFTFPLGTTTVTYEAEDASGNTSTASFDVTVTDNEAPSISHPNESSNLVTTTSADGAGNCTVSIAVPNAVINDNCAVSQLSWTISGASTGSGLNQVGTRIFNIGTSTITYTLSDNNSPALETTLSFDIVVTDDELPTLNLPSNITANGCSDTVTYSVSGNDNCGVSSIIQTDSTGLTSGDSFPSGTTTLEYEITDVNGLTFSDTFTITVIDSTLPVVNCPANVTINNNAGLCTADFDYQVIASDDCLIEPTLTWTMTGASTDSGADQIGVYSFPVGVTTVTFTVDDGSNTDTCSSTVTVIDNESPVITCPVPAAIYSTDLDACTTSLTFAATAVDNCDTSPALSYTISGSSISFPYDFPIGTTVVDVIANTTNGLTDNCSFNVVVEDNQDPIITCPTVATSYPADAGLCIARLSIPATATDNVCIGSPAITYTVAGSTITFPYNFPTGSTIVTATANDGNGQIATCDYTVVVVDDQNPVANCVGSFDVTLNASGSASIMATDINNLSSDNCGIQNLILDKLSFDCDDLGANTVTLTVTDTSGNTSSCMTTINVLDPASTAGVEINVDNNPICQDGDIEFTATPINGGSTPVYEWFINGNSQGTNSASFVPFTTINDGDEVYVQMQSSNSSCETPVQSASIFITVFALPIVTAPAELCLGTSGNLTPSSGGTWTSNNTSIATVNNAGVINALSAGSVTFTYTSSTGGCTNTTDPVVVNPLPVLTSPATVCVGTTGNLTPNSAGTWTSNNPAVATVTNAGVVTGLSTGFATFTFENANGCENITNSVEILESPVIDSIVTSSNPLCSGETVTMQATLQPSSNPPLSRTLINYDFNLGFDTGDYVDYDGQEIPGIISDMVSSTMTYNYGYNGINTDVNAFTTNFISNSTTGNSLRQIDGNGNNDDGEWIFDIGGSVLDDYRDFRIYFQTIRNNAAGSPKFIDISYRANGTGPFIDVLQYDMNAGATVWREVLFALPPEADNAAQLEIKLYVNDGRNNDNNRPDIRIDNFQLQGNIGGDIVSYSWTADTGANAGLPASALIPSTGNSIIQVNPTVNTNYTLTVQSSGNGCTDTETVNIAVTQSPELFVTAEYCPVDDPSTTGIDESDLVQLVVTSPSDPDITYEWQTNPVQTGSSIYVDIADIYTVIGTSLGGCSTLGTVSIAEELVIDGDFTNLDLTDPASFPFTTSTTTYIENQPGLVPTGKGELWFGPDIYTIGEDADDVHGLVNGTILDRTNNTNGPRNWMMINSDQGPYCWQQINTPVLPNTEYYFSGWIRNWLNGSPAQVQFEVDGVLVGTTQQSTNSWERFYGTWTSGPTQTSVDIRIANLNTASGGNDFGIDDISFATLSTFIRLDTVLETTDQRICQNTPIETIEYAIGGGLATPTIEWSKDGSPLATNVYPDGLSFLYNGSSYFISGTPTEFGVYTYTLSTTSACDVKSAEGIITVDEAPAVVINNLVEPICFSNSSIVMNATLSGSATSGTWSTSGTGTFTGVSGNGSTATYNVGTGETSGTVTLTFTSNDPAGVCEAAVETYNLEITPYIIAEAGTVGPITDCDDITVSLLANNVSGTWTVTSGQPSGSYFFSNPSLYNSQFTGESGEEYTLQWEAVNVMPCANTTDNVTITIPDCGNNIDFDGVDDYISFADNYNMNSSAFSLEAWIKTDNVSGSKTIMSKRNGNALTSGYDLMLVNNRLRFRWNNAAGLQSNQTLNSSKWYHVAVTFNGSNTYTLFIDGFSVGSTTSGTIPSVNTNRFIIGATDRTNTTPNNFFGGAIDEVRIWDSALTQTQIRQMMNQELVANGTNVQGVIVPQDIGGLQWSNLMGYYQMIEGSQSIITNGNIGDISTVFANSGKLNSMNTIQAETAPIPYVTSSDNVWDASGTWLNGGVQQIPNSAVNSINGSAQTWNIVRSQNNISTNRATSVLGLLVDSDELSVINDQPLTVSRYLKIDGKLDLDGESQLLQPNGSIVDLASAGSLERDQQGTSNLYNYNYWSSPVSSDGSSFSIDGVLRDGSSPSAPVSVNWTSSYDASASPLTLSRRWLYTYMNLPENSYADWAQVSETTPLNVGQGFTMKGSGGSGSQQNYVFEGIPNNGDISMTLGANNQALLGNPYPSAIDGWAFITDNESSFKSGTLDFWEHAPSNSSHILAQYEGGYAVLSLSGGVAAVTPPSEIGGIGNATKVPGRYIPIAQGFFITANATGGQVLFQNSQRAFRKEGTASSIFLRNGSDDSGMETEDEIDIKRIRFDFISPENAVRHLLLAFIENGEATDGVDYGYDAPNNDNFPSDMSFDIDGNPYVIQGVGAFDETKMYPLIVTLANGGTIQIPFDAFENFDETIDLFIYDAQLDTYTNFNTTSYQITLEAGDYTGRFFLAFQEDQTLSVIDNEIKDIQVDYLQTSSEIYVKTPNSINVKQIYLINITGQTVGSWNSTNQPMSHEIRIPVQNISEGNYILKVETNYSTYNKKIIIKY